VTVLFNDETDDPLEPMGLAELAAEVLEAEGVPDGAELSITLVVRSRMAELNERYLGRAGPTDVLAFPIEDLTPGAVPGTIRCGPPLLVGDVVICPDVVRDNAARHGVAFEDEMALMAVHGILHLLGYDHEVDADAERMEDRERALLAGAGRVRR
jgi:probable rRNA maturation factor